MPSLFPKLEPRLNKRERNIFAKKKPKVRKAILIALGLGVLTGAGYVFIEKIRQHERERGAVHQAEIVSTREKIKATRAVIVEPAEKKDDPPKESFDL